MKQTTEPNSNLQERVDKIVSKYPGKHNTARIEKVLMGERGKDTKEYDEYMDVVKGTPGEHIDTFVQRLVTDYIITQKPVKGKFNDVVLIADKGITADMLIEKFHKQMETNSVIYHASPEYKHQQKLDNLKKKSLQEKCDEYVKELETLDFTNYETVLDWFCKYQDPSDSVGVNSHKDIVLKAFRDHGFKINENTGKNFNENDEENYARYIVGQCLSTLEVVAVHHMVITFTERRKKKFNKAMA